MTRSIPWRLQGPDYGCLLPFSARLPLSLGASLSRMRGRFAAHAARDWAELAVGEPYVRTRTLQAAAQLWPNEPPAQALRQRYQCTAREEWHAALIRAGRLDELTLDLAPARRMLAEKPSDRGLLVVTAHFDSFIIGMLGLGLCGQRTNIATSNVYVNDAVHPAVQAHFEAKYRAGERYLHGGSFLHVESSMRALLRALQRHETVVVVADAPAPEQGPGIWLQWLGQRRKLAEGAMRMARETGSLMSAMLSVARTDTRIDWLCSSVLDPAQDPDCAQQLFGFLEEPILAYPGRWWAAHLLGDFPVQGKGQ